MANKIKFNKEVAIGITTFLRNASLYRLIESILEYLPDIKIYLVDQDISTKFKRTLYDGLISRGHVIKQIDYDCGISKARQILKRLVKEPFLCFMQDDFTVTPKTNLMNMVDVLKNNPKVGVVGARLEGAPITGSYTYFFLKMGDGIMYLPLSYCVNRGIIQWQKTPSGVSYIPADIVSEFTVWRKSVDNIFDEKVKVIEHSHTYLLLKYKTDWKIAYTPDSEILHRHDKEEKLYNSFRGRKEDIDYIHNYWNVKESVKFDIKKYKFLLEHQSYHIPAGLPIINPEIKKPVTIEAKKDVNNQNFIAMSEEQSSSSYLSSEVYTILDEFIDIINLFEKVCYLSKKTCLHAVVNRRLNHSINYLTVPPLSDVELQLLNNKGFYFNSTENSFTKNNHVIMVDKNIPRNFKEIRMTDNPNVKYHIPMPVIEYFTKLYGSDWRKVE